MTRKIASTEPVKDILDLNGMSNDEKQLFFEVLKGAISNILSLSQINSVERQERLFRSHANHSLKLASLFIHEYRDCKKAVRRTG